MISSTRTNALARTPPCTAVQHSQVPAPSLIANDPNAGEFQPAEYQLMIVLSNRSLREALAVALNGVPLLEALQAPQSILAHLQSNVLSRAVLIDPAIASAFERIIRLRRNVTDPTNTDVLALDNGVRSAILRFRERILRRRR